MAKPLKAENTHTTISVRKDDKKTLRRFAKFIKNTRNGKLYESDSIVFARVMDEYIGKHSQEANISHTTYPSKKEQSSPSTDLPDYTPSDTK